MKNGSKGGHELKRIIVAGSLILLLIQPVLPLNALAQVETSATESSNYFKDLKKTHWAAPAIMKLVNKGYMNGYENQTFKPNQYTTRAEAAAVIARTMGISMESDFKLQANDVSTIHPYYKEIRKLAELGIIQNNEQFHPEEPLKRAHIAKMIALAYKIEVDGKNKSSFKDMPKNYWAKNYIDSLADVEIVTGKTSSLFEPNHFVTRAHIAALTVRGMEFQQKVKNREVAYDYLSKNYITTKNDYTSWTREVILLVNDIRKEKRLHPLLEDSALSQVAIIKAQDMITRNYFEHASPRYGNPWDMASLFDYDYTSYGENIARNFMSPKDTVAGWMASSKHRENILKNSYTHIGVGIKKAKNGKFYWVQHFSSK